MRPRGILFAAFAGEELGLRSSRYYTQSSTLPVENAVAMVNLNMIGRLRHDRLYLGGIELLFNLAPAVEGMAKAKGLTFTSRLFGGGRERPRALHPDGSSRAVFLPVSTATTTS
jgi:Zn-dependent M28 family amino/carboxypeptidase